MKPISSNKMMKIKKNNKVLLLLLMLVSIFVWTQVIIQLFRNTQVGYKNRNNVSESDDRDRDSIEFLVPDTSFILKIDKVRNPFAIARKVSIRTRRFKSQKAIPDVVPPPAVKYLGFIADENEPLALIQLPDDQSMIMKVGDHIQEFYLKTISMDSVVICKEKYSYTFYLIGE